MQCALRTWATITGKTEIQFKSTSNKYFILYLQIRSRTKKSIRQKSTYIFTLEKKRLLKFISSATILAQASNGISKSVSRFISSTIPLALSLSLYTFFGTPSTYFILFSHSVEKRLPFSRSPAISQLNHVSKAIVATAHNQGATPQSLLSFVPVPISHHKNQVLINTYTFATIENHFPLPPEDLRGNISKKAVGRGQGESSILISFIVLCLKALDNLHHLPKLAHLLPP